jgi:hypothetical protein
MSDHWRLCSGCKTPIGFGEMHYVCSVSTCNRKRTGMTFCSVSCWEAHLPMMRHREAYAVEARAPSRAEHEAEKQEEERASAPRASADQTSTAPMRRRVVSPPAADDDADVPRDILIVASKLKKYIKARSGMNTSDHVMRVLSDHVRAIADEAIRNAGRAERKTVLDRDVPPVRR